MVRLEYGICGQLCWTVIISSAVLIWLIQLLSWNHCVNMLRHCANSSTSLKKWQGTEWMLWIQGRLRPETSAQYQSETVQRGICRRRCEPVTSSKFHTGVFFAIIDSMTGALKKRLDAYTLVRNSFGFLHEIFDLTPVDPQKFQPPVWGISGRSGTWSGGLTCAVLQLRPQQQWSQARGWDSFELRLYRIASAPGVREAFPNINIALRIYLSLLATNCSGERSFSVLAWVKNNLRTTMTDQRLSNLSLSWSKIWSSMMSLTYLNNLKHVKLFSKMLNNSIFCCTMFK